ncbi:MAG TPA: dihydroorotate dehydrogenase [Rhodobacteraceae bacterium]|nr:dihydroorotate dehydrogenase [Paracoccaceae bacterium]
MKMVNEKPQDDLELYFAAERNSAVQPSNDLLRRVMADAEAALPDFERSADKAKSGVFSVLWRAIGGWPVVAGLAAATVAGVWIGFSQPAGIERVSAFYLGQSDEVNMVDLLYAFDAEFGEG